MAFVEPIVPVILSGGSGTRLWPMSRAERPKQLLALTGDATMLQMTASRCDTPDYAPAMVVANAAHAVMIEEQLADAGCAPQALILEPAARNTAPAIALAAFAAGGGDVPLLVMPSDHVIRDVDAFRAAVARALPLVRAGWLATFGIEPDAPETGYGYLAIGDELADGVHRVARFVEKPKRDVAEAMLAAGGHVWNGGIFLFTARAYLAALALHAPEMHDAARRAIAGAKHEGTRVLPDAQAFAESPSESIDYAVMEKAEQVAVAPVSMGWSDVGSWDALWSLAERSPSGDALSGEVLAIDTANCLVRSDGARIALVGVEDLIVVASGNDILILPRGRSQEVKRVIEALKKG